MNRFWRTTAMSFTGTIALLAAALLLNTGCSKSPDAGTPNAGAQSPATLPEGVLLNAAPEGAVDVAQAKSTAQPGDKVTVRGRIGGRRDPFVGGRAMFQLVDASIPTCADNASDGCPTPWDYCCEPKDQVTAKSATVQLAGADGKPLGISLNGAGGLKPMAMVIVRGEVVERPNDSVMVIAADGMYVEQ